jgi:hypothetical protein
MLGPCFKQSSSSASGNAHALLQAMLKHCRTQCSSMEKAYRVRLVRTTYGEHEQIMRGRRRRSWGRSPVQSLTAKSVAGLGQADREDCPLPWHPTKRPRDAHSNLVSSSRLVSPFETASYLDVRNGQSDAYAKKLSNTRQKCFWIPPTTDPSHVSCKVPCLTYVSCHRPM